jgi:hypothetical protein
MFLRDMLLRIPLLVVLLGAAVRAQAPTDTTPKFVWQGDVDETAVLRIRGDHLDVQSPKGERVQHQRYRFFHLPPDSRQQVRLEILEGRGSVRIARQPTADNDYTMEIDIEDLQQGRAHYSIALYWDSPADEMQEGAKKWRDRGWQGDDVSNAKESTGKMTWRGHVDSDATVECQASACRSQSTQGMPVGHERVRFEKPLPQQEVAVSLTGDDANGNIRVVQQPLRSNNYAVRVQIADGCGNRKECMFTLTWREVTGAAEEKQAAQRGLFWSGTVSGTARVTVRDSSTLSGAEAGGSLANEQTVFDRPLPHRAGLSPAIRKVQGRGSVVIVEPPSDQNGFSLIFEVHDSGPGTDNYAVEVAW